MRDWAAEVERRVRREMAVAVYFILAVYLLEERDRCQEIQNERWD